MAYFLCKCVLSSNIQSRLGAGGSCFLSSNFIVDNPSLLNVDGATCVPTTPSQQQRDKRMSNPSPTLPNNRPTSAQGGIRNDGGTSGITGNCIVALTPKSLITEPKDSENDMWNMYLDEVKEDDQRMTDTWKEDANGLLVFVSLNLLVSLFILMTSLKTGLFSATVGAFIIEFYKTLSPDSGSQTVALLGQISQQLANFPNGNYSNAAIQPSPPSASMVWVIAMWMISLVLSLTSALIATLLQQWARRYVETPKVPNEPNHRARVRLFLFLGTNLYRMRVLVEIAPTLLHLSVYLFFAGLVIIFHTINTKVAIAVDVSVGLFALAYIMLSILPSLDFKCPYRTPMSRILWRPCHVFLFFTAHCLHSLLKLLHRCFVKPSLDGIISSPWQRKLVDWLDSRENAIRKHYRYFMDGFEKNVINAAVNAREGDHKIITSLFSVLSLSNENKLRKLAASIPRHRILDLIRPVEFGKIGLRDPLLVLLRNCEAGTGATGPDEDARKRALSVCLDAIHHISKTPDVPELNFVRANFAKIGLMETLWDDGNTAIRVTSLSICALIARRVGRRDRLEEEDLRWLERVTGETSHAILNADVETRDRMNFKSFVRRVLLNQVGDLPTEDATSFRETVAILLDARTDPDFDLPSSQNRLSEEVGRIHQDDPQGSREIVDRLRLMFPFIPPPFPVPMI
jgi:hypothetical protein